MDKAATVGPKLLPGFRSAAAQLAKRAASEGAWDPIEESVGAELDIETEYKRKLAGLRRLPARDHTHALRAARETRRHALNALKERRRTARHARHRVRLEQKPAPS